MINQKYVTEYIEQHKNKHITLNKDRIDLIKYLENHVLSRDDLYFDEKQIENFIKFTERWYFELEPFQKFIVAFVFLFYKEDESVFFEQFLIMMARGAGKNGLITAFAHYFISPLHGIDHYNVEIVANSEKQAKTSFQEMYNKIADYEVLNNMFYRTKMLIESNDTKSIVQYHTSNADTKDGLRSGMIIYDEVAVYESFDTVNVFSSGLGKVRNGREFFISTDGYVRDGFLDKTKERAMNILKGEELNDPLFPFICRIDDKEEMDNEDMWQKANPIFHQPMSLYGKGLFKKVRTQYIQLRNNPSGRKEFITKRMNLPESDIESSVADWEDILATNKPMPDLEHRTCVGSLDFSSVRDFTSVGLLFKVGNDYVWKTHSFARREYLEQAKLKPPIYDWEQEGLLTIVDGPVIDIKHVVDWFVRMREKYNITTIVADTFRLDIVKKALENEGFHILYIRNPRAIHSLLAPRIETMFANHNLIFGDNPLMRWFCNNVYVKIKPDGNKEYLKKDEHRRKTDGFQALIHSLWQADNYLEEDDEIVIDALSAINF